jgi:hypothetical protein
MYIPNIYYKLTCQSVGVFLALLALALLALLGLLIKSLKHRR